MTARRFASPPSPAVPLPSAEDYIRAVQRPDLAFNRPDLVAADFDTHPMLGIPVPASGTSAVVFRATVGGTPQALRFLTREDAATQQRYTDLNRWFADHDLTADVAVSTWVEQAIKVNGRRWPMVQMQWVDGHTLDRHVEDLVEADNRPGLTALAQSWRDLIRRIQTARFAHGDLQHGNVLVDTTGRLRLVDFDSSWIDPFAGSAPPTEGGHRNYQPTNRLWGPWMDTFPGLVIYLSLLALAREPAQWEQLNDGENLLFGHRDFAPPHHTQVWSLVDRLGDPRIDQLAALLRTCCTPGWTAESTLEGLLARPQPWWTRTTSPHAPAPTPPGGPTTTRRQPGESSATDPNVTVPIPPGQPPKLSTYRHTPPGPVPASPGPSTGPSRPADPDKWWQQTTVTTGNPAASSPPTPTPTPGASTTWTSATKPSAVSPNAAQPSAPRPSATGPTAAGPSAAGPSAAAPRSAAGRALRATGRTLAVLVGLVLLWGIVASALAQVMPYGGALALACVLVVVVFFLVRAVRRRQKK